MTSTKPKLLAWPHRRVICFVWQSHKSESKAHDKQASKKNRYMADELELRRELDALARKRAALDIPSAPHRGNGGGGSTVSGGGNGGRKSVLARLGAGAGAGGSGDSPRGAARTASKENAFDDNQQRGSGSNKRGYGDRFSAATKRQRLHSAVPKPIDERNDRAEGPEDVSERKKRAVAPFTQKDTMARSRRMFGALMGHLGKAKAQIERDSDLFKRQDSKQHEAEKKEKIQSKTLEEKAKRDAVVQKLAKLIAKTEVDMAEQLARLKLEHLQKTRKSASLSGFLQTVASPPIFYLPAKHTKETGDLVAASKEAHKEKLQISTREHETRLRELEVEYTAKLEKLREELEEARHEEEKAKHEEEKAKNKEVKETSDVAQSAAAPVEETALEEEEADSAEQVTARDGEVAMDEDDEESTRMDEGPEDDKKQDGDNVGVASNAMDDDGDDATAHSSGEPMPESTAQHSEESKEASPASPMEEETAAPAASSAEDIDGGEVQNEEDSKSTDGEMARHDSEQADVATSDDGVADDKNVGVKCSDDQAACEEPKPESSESEAASVPEKQKIDVSSLKVTELREELKKRGLDTKGLKASLVARLEEAVAQDAA